MDIEYILYRILLPLPWIILGFAFHEFCHAWVADHMGDLTPGREGRLTLNPIKHIDIFGLFAIFLTGFGWAKPVHTNPAYYKNPLRDTVYVAIAGPIGNFMLAIVFWIIIRILPFVYPDFQLLEYLKMGYRLMILLGIFNLIPVPPLDGSRILRYFLKGGVGYHYDRLEPYGFFILLPLLLFTKFPDWLGWFITKIVDLTLYAFNFS